jgi:hypothetical protein
MLDPHMESAKPPFRFIESGHPLALTLGKAVSVNRPNLGPNGAGGVRPHQGFVQNGPTSLGGLL